jgi:thiamine kinase-like enzyme
MGAVWCHADMGANNLVVGRSGPWLIDWENSGPLVPCQELGSWVRSLGSLGKPAYRAYQQAGGPADLTDVTHIASSTAVHLNYLGVQAELLLNDEHVEQHEFARAQVGGAARRLPSLLGLEQWIKELSV